MQIIGLIVLMSFLFCYLLSRAYKYLCRARNNSKDPVKYGVYASLLCCFYLLIYLIKRLFLPIPQTGLEWVGALGASFFILVFVGSCTFVLFWGGSYLFIALISQHRIFRK